LRPRCSSSRSACSTGLRLRAWPGGTSGLVRTSSGSAVGTMAGFTAIAVMASPTRRAPDMGSLTTALAVMASEEGDGKARPSQGGLHADRGVALHPRPVANWLHLTTVDELVLPRMPVAGPTTMPWHGPRNVDPEVRQSSVVAKPSVPALLVLGPKRLRVAGGIALRQAERVETRRANCPDWWQLFHSAGSEFRVSHFRKARRCRGLPRRCAPRNDRCNALVLGLRRHAFAR
jgi:hypothetical protein